LCGHSEPNHACHPTPPNPRHLSSAQTSNYKISTFARLLNYQFHYLQVLKMTSTKTTTIAKKTTTKGKKITTLSKKKTTKKKNLKSTKTANKSNKKTGRMTSLSLLQVTGMKNKNYLIHQH
jgi:hypothetical protein